MNIKILVYALALSLCWTGARANKQDFDAVASELNSEVREQLQRLSELRDKVAEEKIPLSQEVNALENEVVGLVRELERRERIRDTHDLDLNALRNEVKQGREAIDYMQGLLNDFSLSLESHLASSELQRYRDNIAVGRLASETLETDADVLDKQLTVVELALERLESAIGGDTFSGKALTPEGVMTEGKFVLYGPTSVFKSHGGGVVGLSVLELNTTEPAIRPLSEDFSQGIGDLLSSGRGYLPGDPTGGDALKLERSRRSWSEYVEQGGIIGYAILALGMVALLGVIYQGYSIEQIQVPNESMIAKISEALSGGEAARVESLVGSLSTVVGALATTIVQHRALERTALEDLVYAQFIKVRPQLERFLPFLAMVATASPLMGLLGTVTGIIKTFVLISAYGTGDARNLSSGISEALVTTALGLIVAIPILVFHGLLKRRAQAKLAVLEQVAITWTNAAKN